MANGKPDVPQDHKTRLGMEMVVDVNTDIFTKEELAFLQAYGCWATALADGEIEPITEAQVEFLKVCKGEKEAVTMWEKAWWKLQERRKIEPEYKNAPQYDLVDPFLEGNTMDSDYMRYFWFTEPSRRAPPPA